MADTRTLQRWTADTRIAFLLGLRLYGTVKAAAEAIGRSSGVVHQVRARDPDFAAAWDAALAERRGAEQAAKAGAGPDAALLGGADGRKRVRDRWDGFSQVRRRHFLRALSETGEVKAACRKVRVTEGAAHRMRAADPDFAAAWERALATSGPVLDQIAWDRAVNGWEEPIFSGGKQVGTRWRHSPGLLAQMVAKRDKAKALADDPEALRERAEEAARAAGGFFYTPATREETNAAILKKLEVIEKRVAMEAAGLVDPMAATDDAPPADG